jgi:hypothetical protein
MWHDPETLENNASPNHSAAYLIAILAVIVLAGGIALVAIGGGSKHHSASPNPIASGVPASPSPSSATTAAPNGQATPPLATPSPDGSAPPAAKGTPLSAAAYQAVIHRALGARSAHSIANETVKSASGSVSARLRFDDLDGPTSGSQRITVNGVLGLVRVVGKDTYLKASTQMLAGFFGTTAQAAVTDNDRWIHLVSGDHGYGSVTANVTLSSTLASNAMVGPFTRLAPQTKDGVRVYGIQGHPAGKNGSSLLATLWVALSGNQLPVEFDLDGQGLSSVQTFVDWGTAVQVSKPAGAVDGRAAFPASGGNAGGGTPTGPGVPV